MYSKFQILINFHLNQWDVFLCNLFSQNSSFKHDFHKIMNLNHKISNIEWNCVKNILVWLIYLFHSLKSTNHLIFNKS